MPYPRPQKGNSPEPTSKKSSRTSMNATAELAAPSNATAELAAPSNSSVEIGDKEKDLQTLRLLREEVQGLKEVLDSIKEGKASLSSCAEIIKKTMADIEEIIIHIKESTKLTNGKNADDVRRLLNIWERVETLPILRDPTQKINDQEQTCCMSMIETLFKEVEFIIGYITIPHRLNDWISLGRPGYYVPFYDVFQNEVKDKGNLEKILKFLKYAPEVFRGGLIDEETGLVYRYELNPLKRLFSFLWILGALLASIGILYSMAHWSIFTSIEDWPLGTIPFGTILLGWFAVVLGVILHIAVGTTKRMQSSQTHPPIMSMNDLPLLINAKVSQVMLKIMTILVGFLGLVFVLGVDKNIIINGFLIGYSLDSVFELFSAAIEKKASSQVKALQEKLGGGE